MYALLVEENRGAGLSLHEAVQRADESLLPEAERRALENRRAFQHLLPGARQ